MGLTKKGYCIIAVSICLFCYLFLPACSVFAKDAPLNVKYTPLKINQFVGMVCKQNFNIVYKKLDWQKTFEKVNKARSIFEPDLVASFTTEQNSTQNTAEEYFDRTNSAFIRSDEFNEKNNFYKTGIEGLLPSGARYDLGLSLTDSSNDLVDDRWKNEGITDPWEYQSYFGLKLTQPLLKNAWIPTTTANIKMADKDKDISYQDYRLEVLRVVGEALKGYWELYYAQKQYEIHKDSVDIAMALLKTNEEWVKEGKMPETQLYDAKAGLLLRKALLNDADQKLTETQNAVYTLIGQPRIADAARYYPEDSPLAEKDNRLLVHSFIFENALKYRPDYLKKLITAQKQDIKIAYAKNQKLPQVDFKATCGLNGLALSAGDAMEEMTSFDYITWSVGLALNVPLFGGKDAKSELKAAQYERRKTLLQIKAAEVRLANEINTTINQVKNAREQVEKNTENAYLRNKMLTIEINRLSLGHSNVQAVLGREKEVNKARKGKVKANVIMAKSLVNLRLSEGTLLDRFDITVNEITLELNIPALEARETDTVTDDDKGKRKLFLEEKNNNYEIISDILQTIPEKPQLVKTPLIAVAKKNIKPISKKDSVIETLNQWLSAWSAKDMDTYASFYDSNFYSDGFNKKNWVKRKRGLAKKYDFINVTGSKFEVEQKEQTCEVSFFQEYESSGLTAQGTKWLKLVNKGGLWKISQESWKEK